MRTPRLLLPLVGALLALLVGGLLTPAHAAPVAEAPVAVAAKKKAVKPAQDFPHLPKQCATRAEKIPASPLICYLKPFKEGRPTVVLWGDSHAWMFIPALKTALAGHKVNLVASLMGSCPPMDTNYKAGTPAPACVQSNDLALRYVLDLAKKPAPVRLVLGASWQRYLHALRVGDRKTYVGQMARYFKQGSPRLFKTLARKKIDADVIGQVATVPDKHRRCGKGNLPFSCSLPRRRALPEFARTMKWLTEVSSVLPGTYKPIRVNQRFCTKTACRGLVRGVHTWFDDFHISATMSASLSTFFKRTTKLIDPPKAVDPEEPPKGGGCVLLIFCKRG